MSPGTSLPPRSDGGPAMPFLHCARGTVVRDQAKHRQRDKGPRHETPATSRRREDTQRIPGTNFRTGGRKGSGHVFLRAPENEGVDSVCGM
jgi:hypothetical protein